MQIARFAELADLTQIQSLADANYKANGMPIGILDAVDNTILAGAGWQDICTRFHRAHPLSCIHCQESDAEIQRRIASGQSCAVRCKNGLWDIGIPILVNGHHVASVFLGQFFYDHEVPDRDYFIRQAAQFGYDLPTYLQALDHVPRFSHERVELILEYNTAFARVVSDLAEKNGRLLRDQDELARSEHRLRTLINLAPYGALEFDLARDGRLIFIGANHAAERIIGGPCAQFYGMTLEEAFPEVADTRIPALLRGVAGGGAPIEEDHFEYQDQQFHGFYEFSAIPIAHGRVAVFFRDISERKRTEAALIKRLEVLTNPLDDTSDLHFADLFDVQEVQRIQDAFAAATGVASIITDPAGKPLTRPSRFCHLCEGIIRQTEKGLANCMCSDAALGKMNPDGPIMQPCLSGGLWDGGTSICVGERHIANWLIGQVLDEDADINGMLRYAREIGADEAAYLEALTRVPRMSRTQFAKVCQALFLIAKQLSLLALQNVQQAREITRRVTAEEQRRKLEIQIQHAQKLESLGVLAGGIAHDFNNLLMAILGHTDLAMQDLSPVSPVRENLREIETASRRAAGLCQQMLAYSGRGKFVIQVVDLAEVVEEMAHMLEVSISKKVVLRYNFAPDLPPIEADVTQLRQVVMNLIVNASEAIGNRSGVVAVSTGAMECDRSYLSETWLDEKLHPGLYVYLEVADTGAGMDRETLAKIFDPFFTTKFTGRGLGLAAVLGIVRGHKGAIKVYSESGRGTTFKILFPASRRPAQRLSAERAPAQTWQTSGSVLLVDDEETIRALCKKMLERFGFTVLTAADGREALKIYGERQDEIRLVLLDLTMPHMDGEEAFRELRRLRGDVCVVVASGYNEMEVSQRFVGKGLAGFIQKPYQMRALEQVLRKALGETKNTA